MLVVAIVVVVEVVVVVVVVVFVIVAVVVLSVSGSEDGNVKLVAYLPAITRFSVIWEVIRNPLVDFTQRHFLFRRRINRESNEVSVGVRRFSVLWGRRPRPGQPVHGR